jgi:hypothetical protein
VSNTPGGDTTTEILVQIRAVLEHGARTAKLVEKVSVLEKKAG